jgi:hypothetical protein
MLDARQENPNGEVLVKNNNDNKYYAVDTKWSETTWSETQID